MTNGLVKSIVCAFESQILALCPQLIAEHNYERKYHLVAFYKNISVLSKLYRLIKMTPDGLSTVETDLQKYIREGGIQDMHANVSTITTVSYHFYFFISELLGP